MDQQKKENAKEKPRESSWKIPYDKFYPKLEGDITADVVIIGGGITGIWSAYMLARAGKSVVVLEKRPQILENTTFFTAAFITQDIDTDFSTLKEIFGFEKAKLVWQSGRDAIELIAKTIKEENIDCEFKRVPIFTYAKNEKEFEELEEEYKEIKNAGFEAKLYTKGVKKDIDLGFDHAGVLEVPDQAMYHPLKFGHALAKLAEGAGAKIFIDSKVLELEELTAKTESGTVTGKDIVIATYRPITNEGTHFKKGMYDSYILELEIRKGVIPEGMYMDSRNPYHYFRIDDYESHSRMIVGGEDHRRELALPIAKEKSFSALEEYVKTVIPGTDYKITERWSSGVLEPSDGLALMGMIEPHVFVATAFSGTGMTYAPISAMIIRDLVLGRENPYAELYDPRRIPSLRQLLAKGRDYGGEFFGGIVKNMLK